MDVCLSLLTEEYAMAETVVNGEHGLDLTQTRNVLLSNSTKQRASELHDLLDRLGEGR